MERSGRRQELLAAARRLFATQGYHDTKVDDIVAEAGVAKGTFYLYFKDKRSVFVELVDGLFERIGEAIVRVDVERPVGPQVVRGARAVLGVLLDDPETTEILLSHAVGLDPEFARQIRDFYDGVKTLLRRSLEEGQALGVVAPGNAELYASFTIGALKEILSERRVRTPAERERLAQELLEVLSAGYLRLGGADAGPGVAPGSPRRGPETAEADDPTALSGGDGAGRAPSARAGASPAPPRRRRG